MRETLNTITITLDLTEVARQFVEKYANAKRCSKSEALSDILLWASRRWPAGTVKVSGGRRVKSGKVSYSLNKDAYEYAQAWSEYAGITLTRAVENICIVVALRHKRNEAMKHNG